MEGGEGGPGASVTTLSPRLSLALLAPMLLLWAGLFVYPLLRLLPESLFAPDFTLEHYRRFFTAPLYVGVLLRTLRIAALTTALCLVLGYPTAYFLSRLSPRWTKVALVFVVLPLWTSVIVRVYAWMAAGLMTTALAAFLTVSNPAVFNAVFGNRSHISRSI